jgi:hypothetical protein
MEERGAARADGGGWHDRHEAPRAERTGVAGRSEHGTQAGTGAKRARRCGGCRVAARRGRGRASSTPPPPGRASAAGAIRHGETEKVILGHLLASRVN